MSMVRGVSCGGGGASAWYYYYTRRVSCITHTVSQTPKVWTQPSCTDMQFPAVLPQAYTSAGSATQSQSTSDEQLTQYLPFWLAQSSTGTVLLPEFP